MRKESVINDNWYFTDCSENFVDKSFDQWQRINLPHTWNAVDGADGKPGYKRAVCRYAKELYVAGLDRDKEYYLEFGAAASECRVYVNGKESAYHKGGYSAFRTNVTEILHEGVNTVTAEVSNEPSEEIYPQMADFTFYGGLHRSVKLIEVSRTHFELDYWGAEGIAVTSQAEADGNWVLNITPFVKNADKDTVTRYTVKDASGKVVCEYYEKETGVTTSVPMKNVKLWQGVKSPYLYGIKAELIKFNEVVDCVSVKHGFRNFSVDPEKGFFLNGELTPLRGVSRHGDTLGKGIALDITDHERDCALILESGANTVRLAHYQHSREFYDLCDSKGLIVWAEIPFISKMLKDPAAHNNCLSQLKELIYQNFNHSSIFFWGISNEITISGSSDELVRNLRELNRVAKEADCTRLTTMAQVTGLPMDDVQNRITDVIAYNHYFGWYSGKPEDNEKWFDEFHRRHPDISLGLSEYGCEGIISYHNSKPESGDYSEEYQALYHEHMVKILKERPWIWGSYVWNMFDFGSDARDEGGVAGRNNKGLITFDRRIKKDAFYLYKAAFGKNKTLHICGKKYSNRRDDIISVKVYTNCQHVELTVNGKETEIKKADGEVCVFDNVALADGINIIEAKSGELTDTAFIKKTDKEPEEYVYKEEPGKTGVTNWFENKDMTVRQEMTFREGYYSVRNSVSEIMKSEEAGNVLVNAFSSAVGMKLKKSMLMIMGEQTPEEMFRSDLSKNNLKTDPQAALSILNQELQKIKTEN